MANTVKYFAILESLHLQPDEDDNDQFVAKNLQILQKCLKRDCNELLLELYTQLNVSAYQQTIGLDQKEVYIVYMLHVLTTLIDNINFNSDAKEDLISTRQTTLCIEAIQHASIYALRGQLHNAFYKSKIMTCYTRNQNVNYSLLQLSIECFAKIVSIRELHLSNAMELVLRDVMMGIFSLRLADHENSNTLNQVVQQRLQKHLNYIWYHLTKFDYFRNLMLLKATPSLPEYLCKLLQQELLQKLATKDGFRILTATMLTAQKISAVDEQQTSEVIANIVAFPGHTKRYQQLMIRRIFDFCRVCVENEAMIDAMGIGILSIRRLYDLNSDNQCCFAQLLAEQMQDFIVPVDVLSGLIVMEHADLCARINLLYQLFCTSIVAFLPSALLVNYLPLFLQLYDSLPATLVERQQVASIIIRCLDNREPKRELVDIVKRLYTNNYLVSWKRLHARLRIVLDTYTQQLSLKVVSVDRNSDFDVSLILPTLLMANTHHALTHKVFISLLRIMEEQLNVHTADRTSVELISTEIELMDIFQTKYPAKVNILLSLNMLIAHQPLKAQMATNPQDFLQFLSEMLQHQLESTEDTSLNETSDQTLMLLLNLLQELLTQFTALKASFALFKQLEQLRILKSDPMVHQRIDVLISLLNGELKATAKQNDTILHTARTLIESKESHLQVYGIQMLLNALRARDEETISQGHIIVALCLSTLQSKESYTFLNCVRLFVELINIMESETLELLEGEYLTETVELDYRLVVGETILKVAKELGPLCYKYKVAFLNCFMHGVRSQLEEFRMSAYANLANICRILTYQVQDFFQELLQIIDSELTTGTYLPAKRAAVFVLSELLEGMNNLTDFGELLLPVYRLLRTIETSEVCDNKMRLHASNGLKALNDKCRDILFPKQNLQKEVRILGLQREKSTQKRSKHILEIN